MKTHKWTELNGRNAASRILEENELRVVLNITGRKFSTVKYSKLSKSISNVKIHVKVVLNMESHGGTKVRTSLSHFELYATWCTLLNSVEIFNKTLVRSAAVVLITNLTNKLQT